MRRGILLMAAILAPLCAQEIRLPENLQRLADQADSSVNVTLDGPLLRFAGSLMAGQTEHQANVKRLISGLQGIYVRSFEFAAEGQYTPADLDAVRDQFRGPAWSRIVGIKSRADGDADVYLKSSPEGKLQGIGVVVAESRQLTIVSIAGTLDPADLAHLGGEFGIPRLAVGHWRREEADSK